MQIYSTVVNGSMGWGVVDISCWAWIFPILKERYTTFVLEKNNDSSFAMMTGFSATTSPIKGFLSRKKNPASRVWLPHLPSFPVLFWYFEFKLSLLHLHKDVGAHQANETAHLPTAGTLDFNLILCEVPGAISKAHQSGVFRSTNCACVDASSLA